MDTWYERAKMLAKKKGIKIKELANSLEIKPSTLGHYLTGRCDPSIERFTKIIELLETTPAFLLHGITQASVNTELEFEIEQLKDQLKLEQLKNKYEQKNLENKINELNVEKLKYELETEKLKSFVKLHREETVSVVKEVIRESIKSPDVFSALATAEIED